MIRCRWLTRYGTMALAAILVVVLAGYGRELPASGVEGATIPMLGTTPSSEFIWSALRSMPEWEAPAFNGEVRAAVVWDDGGGDTLYVGGTFTEPFAHLARWDGVSWSDVGGGTDGDVYSLAVHDGKLVAGGWFGSAGGVAANNIARWNGTTWSPLGGGVRDPVNEGPFVLAMASSGTDLYVGGGFIIAGANGANHVARWYGTSWFSLSQPGGGNGVNGYPFAIADHGGQIVVGGTFSAAASVAAGNVARWSPTAGWSSLGTGTDSTVYALLSSGTFARRGLERHGAGTRRRWIE